MPIRSLIIVLVAAAAFAGCGRRGDLEEPGAAVATTPAPAGAGISPLDPGAPSVIQEPAPQAGPERRFFLDFLL